MPTSKSSIDHRDVYYRKGKSAGYRARSAYKLLHLDEEFDLFTNVCTAVDLCAAPGSWSQVLGQKLKPKSKQGGEGTRVVSCDLQPMAPLPNITTLQTDITLPSTIPLVLDALGGRKADLVVCDGAPDVTGVHDLDAYLHSQLLLAALTLSLTLMAPGATLIFKIFLSPLDPHAEFLASQLRCFFSSPFPEDNDEEENEFGQYGEFEEEAESAGQEGEGEKKRNVGKQGYDPQGRRGGVWVRKPRSSRQGSAEAFIVCRNFSPSALPLPPTFSPSALDKLRTTTGTLTLDSLSSLVPQDEDGSEETQRFKGSEQQVKQQWQRWEMIKGYVGGGDLSSSSSSSFIPSLHPVSPPSLPAQSPKTTLSSPPKLHLPIPTTPPNLVHHILRTPELVPPHSATASPKALQPQPTPVDEPPEYFSPTRAHARALFLSPTKIKEHRQTQGQGQGQGGGGTSRQSSLDSLTPNPSPVGDVDPTRPWTSSSLPSSTLPPAPTFVPPTITASSQEKTSLNVPLRLHSSSTSSAVSDGGRPQTPATLGVITPALASPALSSSSKTDLFFSASSAELPTPPRALSPAAALGKGPLSASASASSLSLDVGGDERARSTTMPSSSFPSASTAASWTESGIPPVKLRLPPRKERFREIDIPAEMKDKMDADRGRGGWGAPLEMGFGAGFEEISTSRLRSISNPIAPPSAHTFSPAPPAPPPVALPFTTQISRNDGDSRPEFARQSSLTPTVVSPQTPRAGFFPFTNAHTKANAVLSSSSPSAGGDTAPPPPWKLRRKESQQLEREHRQAGVDESVKAGDVIEPCLPSANADDSGHEKEKRKERVGGGGGGWRLVKKMGEGAFSAVWSAVPAGSTPSSSTPTHAPTATNILVALKLLTHPLPDPRTRIAFLREASVLRHISHPSIVGYIDDFSTERHDILVLEAAGGGELFELMSDEENRRRMILPAPAPGSEPVAGSEETEIGWDKDGEGFVRRVFSELVKAVGWLHEVGVVHRDIKLENILFTTNPFLLPPTSTSSIPLHLLPPPCEPLIKLTDFGLSRFISPASPLLYTRCGSESFAAPEIIMGKPYDGRETDAWALGVVLYGLIIGELPFDREESMMLPERIATPGGGNSERERGRKKMHRIAKGEYTWPSPEPALSQDIPGAYAPGTATPSARAVVSSLLERNPSKRAKPSDLWGYEWMLGPGGVPRPVEGAGTPQQEGVEKDKGREASGRGRRRVLDGFLVEEEGIEDVAMTEH
ncbi:tRNA (cytidine32/guanosine34-2'-O)-methyltransferase [Cryptococcus neoformans Bt15]|nr:tRNA (cytidine32/guanosine34-2'-O)-methyltransferase [Cryptococcus neoformans var. grubii Bt15]